MFIVGQLMLLQVLVFAFERVFQKNCAELAKFFILEKVGPNENYHATLASTFWCGRRNFILKEGSIYAK
jgi:hypothetical protein